MNTRDQTCHLQMPAIFKTYATLSLEEKVLFVALTVLFLLTPLITPIFGGLWTRWVWKPIDKKKAIKVALPEIKISEGGPVSSIIPKTSVERIRDCTWSIEGITDCKWSQKFSSPISIPESSECCEPKEYNAFTVSDDDLSYSSDLNSGELMFPISGISSPIDSEEEDWREGETLSCLDLFDRLVEYLEYGCSKPGIFPISKGQATEILTDFCEVLPPGLQSKGDYGFIEKRDLPDKSQVFVRADIHGDLETLIGNLCKLQELGILDENLHCKGAHLVFLGDFMDRGQDGLLVLCLLARLKTENKESVHLIRGNHEAVLQNLIYGGSDLFFQEFTEYESSEEAFNLLNRVYERLPLSLYLSCQTRIGNREYVQLSHGMFEIRQDVSELLKAQDAVCRLAVSKSQKFSERVKAIDFDPETDYEALLKIERKKPNFKRSTIKKIKLRDAAKSISLLAKEEEESRGAYDELTPYMWGDVSSPKSKHSQLGELMSRDWKIMPQDIKRCFLLNSGVQKVKLLFRGHEHLFHHHLYLGKLVATTLPVAMGYQTKSPLDKQDRSYLFKVAPKVKMWTKQALIRTPGEKKIKLTHAYPITSTQV